MKQKEGKGNKQEKRKKGKKREKREKMEKRRKGNKGKGKGRVSYFDFIYQLCKSHLACPHCELLIKDFLEISCDFQKNHAYLEQSKNKPNSEQVWL